MLLVHDARRDPYCATFSSSARHGAGRMRLNKYQQKVIRTTVAELFGPQADVWLFGSRIDDQARGGDIDLLIRLDRPIEQSERAVVALVARLQRRLGDQPIDVLLLDPSIPPGTIHTEALRRGIKL